MGHRAGLLRWGIGLALAVTAVLTFSASAGARTRSARAATVTCTTIVGAGQVTVPGAGTLTVVDHLTTDGGTEQFEARTFPPFGGPALVQLSQVEHAACAKTSREARFSADGLATYAGHERYSISLTFRFFGGHTYLSLYLVKPGFKSLRFTDVEFTPWCTEAIS